MNTLIKHFLIVLLLPIAVNAETLVLSDAQLKKMQVSTSLVVSNNSAFTRQYSAEVTIPNDQTQMVTVPQTGLVSALQVATGQMVKKGQVIAQISSAEFVGLQGEYLQAKTKLALATDAAARDKALSEEGIIPKRRYLEARSAQQALNTEVMQKKQALQLAGMSAYSINRLNSASKMASLIDIVAPMNGQVLVQHAQVGDRLDSGMPLYQIGQLNPLWVEMNVPIEEAANLANGLQVTVPKAQASGQVIAVLRSVNKATQTLQVRAAIDQGTQALSIGQFVEVALALKMPANSLQLPAAALVKNGQQTIVFKRVAKGVEIVPVTLLNEDNTLAFVQGALQTGDAVATAGIAALKGRWLGLGAE